MIPDTAQTDSQFGLVVDVGDAVKSKIAVGEVVWFNPHQLSGAVSDNRGLVDIYSIDEEAVLAVMPMINATKVFGAEFADLPNEIAYMFDGNRIAAICDVEDGS